MCTSPGQPEEAATGAAQRALEEEEEARLASASLTAGDPTGWFDRLYAAGARGDVPVPWRRRQPHPLLVQWASARDLSGAGQRAVVVGCALGADAEYVAALGFDTTGFDISGTAIRLARQRFPGSAVRYVVADLLDYPQAWQRAYDLVIEIITVQALPDPPRRQAIANVSRLVGPGGTLLAIAAVHDDTTPPATLPPWPLRRAEIEAFGADGLSPDRMEITAIPRQADEHRWLAEFHRPRRVGQDGREDPGASPPASYS
jgi:SAM-dependent methyltransferase